MNLVVGGTGLLGGEICRLLSAKGKAVRALVRSSSDQSKVARLESLNIETALGDLKDRFSLEDACRGVNAVISTASSTHAQQAVDSIQTVDLEGQLNLISAAKANGVGHFVLISFPETGNEFALQTAKRRVEEQLKLSGLTYTILQPTLFIEVWLSPALGFDAADAKAQIYGSGDNKISWISYKDVAKFAVASLDNPKAVNAVVELGGPQALSPLEVVKIFEEIQGREFVVQRVPEQELRAQKAAASDPLAQSFAGLKLYYARGNEIDMRETLLRFPVQLTSVADYAQASFPKPGS
jgi:uncharacterized protein YbjT (DUF2867 family)